MTNCVIEVYLNRLTFVVKDNFCCKKATYFMINFFAINFKFLHEFLMARHFPKKLMHWLFWGGDMPPNLLKNVFDWVKFYFTVIKKFEFLKIY